MTNNTTILTKDSYALLTSLYERSEELPALEESDLQRIADDLKMRISDVISVASFYSLFNNDLNKEASMDIKPIITGASDNAPLLSSAAKDIFSYIELGGFSGLKESIKNPDMIISTIQESGLRGCGGAGFPVAKKWSSAKQVNAEEKYIICNACEGEPDTFKDKVLLEECPFSIIEGVIICALAVNASKGIICIRGCYDKAFETMSSALASARQHGYLGNNILGTDFCFDIELSHEMGAYLGGESTGLLEMLEGRHAIPRLNPPHSTTAGYMQKPTVINNAETFAHIPLIMSGEKSTSCRANVSEHQNTRLFTLLGCIEKPGVYEYPLGTTPGTMYINAGGDVKKLIGMQIGGGASGSIVGKNCIDIPMDFSNYKASGISLGTGSIRFFDSVEEIMLSVSQSVCFMSEQSCGTCFSCREGLRQAQIIIKRMLNKEGEEDDIKKLLSIINCLHGNTRCGLGQSALVPLESALQHFRSEFESLIWRFAING